MHYRLFTLNWKTVSLSLLWVLLPPSYIHLDTAQTFSTSNTRWDSPRARASGLPCVREADTIQTFQESVSEALKNNTLTTIVSKVEAISPKSFHMDLALLENRFQFWRSLQLMRKQSTT